MIFKGIKQIPWLETAQKRDNEIFFRIFAKIKKNHNYV